MDGTTTNPYKSTIETEIVSELKQAIYNNRNARLTSKQAKVILNNVVIGEIVELSPSYCNAILNALGVRERM